MEYSQELADEICDRIANGESLRSIVGDENMPASSSIFKWLGEHKSFAEQYARARETQADVIADEVLLIADTEIDSQKARVRIDARKWYAGKLQPKKYGEKLNLGGQEDNPIKQDVSLKVEFVKP